MKFTDDPMRGIALIMSVTCVRNTIIEKFHADGKLDDSDMEAFNRQVADRVYTFLNYLMSNPRDASDLIEALRHYMPTDWDPPQRDVFPDKAVAAYRARTGAAG
jgi:hypothetical protein